MEDKTLLKISFLISVIGIIILFFYTEKIDVGEKRIDKITKDNLDETIKVSGVVTKVTEKENVVFFELKQENLMTVLAFKKESVNLSVGDFVQVVGKIEDYEGKRELIANEITK